MPSSTNKSSIDSLSTWNARQSQGNVAAADACGVLLLVAVLLPGCCHDCGGACWAAL
jgi:hypothetical protein